MRLACTLLCALLIAGSASANELLRIYELALDNDTKLRAAGHARDAALEAKPQAYGVLLPQLNGLGDYSTERDEIKPSSGAFAGQTLTSTSEPYTLSLGLSQVLFNMETFDRLRQSSDVVAAAQASYRATQQDLALRVTEAYFNVLGAADNLRFADAENKAVEQQLEQARKRFEVGLSAITDVQEAQARYDLTVARMIEAEQALSSAKAALAEITNTLDIRLPSLKEEIPLTGPDPENVDAWIKGAAEGNLHLLSARIQADIAKKDISIRRAGHYPTLSLLGSKAVGESAGFNSGEFDQSKLTLQLNVPIFAGGTVQSGVRAARSTHEQRLDELEGTRRQVEHQTRDAYLGVVSGVSRVKALKQAVVSNTTALEASQVGLQVGTRTAIDVLNAQRDLYSAQRDYAKARYDYLLSILRLKSAAGRLSQQDLHQIDQLLTSEPVPDVAHLR